MGSHSRRIGCIPVHGCQQNCLSLKHHTDKDEDDGRVQQCWHGRRAADHPPIHGRSRQEARRRPNFIDAVHRSIAECRRHASNSNRRALCYSFSRNLLSSSVLQYLTGSRSLTSTHTRVSPIAMSTHHTVTGVIYSPHTGRRHMLTLLIATRRGSIKPVTTPVNPAGLWHLCWAKPGPRRSHAGGGRKTQTGRSYSLHVTNNHLVVNVEAA